MDSDEKDTVSFVKFEAGGGDDEYKNLVQTLLTKASKQDIVEYSQNFGVDVIDPPLPIFDLVHLLINSTWHARCVEVKAVVAARQGWQVTRIDGESDDRCTEIAAQLDEMAGYGEDCHGLEDLLSNLATELSSLGNAYVEIGRDPSGRPVEFYHAPATTVRVKKQTDTSPQAGYYQISSMSRVSPGETMSTTSIPRTTIESFTLPNLGHMRKRFFKRFGDENEYALSGEPGNVPSTERANEIIHLKAFHPLSPVYGIPSFVSSYSAMLGDEAASRWNLAFFENNRVPRWLIKIIGGGMSPKTQEAFKTYFLQVLRGRPHVPVVIAIDSDQAKIETEKLEADSSEGDFLNYRDKMRDEILAAHGVPPRMAGVITPGQLGGEGDAEVQRKDFNSFTIKPLQRQLVSWLNDLILPAMDLGEYQIELTEFQAEDPEQEQKKAASATEMAAMGVLSINEARVRIGLDPIPEKWADGHYLLKGGNLVHLTDKIIGKVDADALEDKRIDDNLRVAGQKIKEKSRVADEPVSDEEE